MPRPMRIASGGFAYHVLNRAVGRSRIFAKPRDYEAFEAVIAEAKGRLPMRLLAWCVMPTHWHSRPLAARRRRPVRVHALADGDAHAALARGARHGGQRPALPGPLPVVPHPSGRAPVGGVAVRGAEPVAGQAGPAGRCLAMVELVASRPRRRGQAFGRRARGASPALARARASAADGGGAGGVATRRAAPAPFGETAWQKRTAKRLGLQSTLRPRGRPGKLQPAE